MKLYFWLLLNLAVWGGYIFLIIQDYTFTDSFIIKDYVKSYIEYIEKKPYETKKIKEVQGTLYRFFEIGGKD